MHGKREFADKIILRTLKLENYLRLYVWAQLRRCYNTKRVREEKDGKEGCWEEDTEGGKGWRGTECQVVSKEGDNTAANLDNESKNLS